MYIPSTAEGAAAVRAAFQELKRLLLPLMDKFRAREHWAKIEMDDIDHIRTRLSSLYPHWNEFIKLRARSDPAGLWHVNRTPFVSTALCTVASSGVKQ